MTIFWASLMTSQEISLAFETVCLEELEAIKPGNVHIFADGHGMVVEDFVKSAKAAAAVIANPALTIGERIRQAVEATWEVVGCNTNLGILLLAAPLLESALKNQPLQQVLAGLTRNDAVEAFQAIVKASPAGLRREGLAHDVFHPPQCTLLEAMIEAAPRDRVAYQYAHHFLDVREIGLPLLYEARNRWERKIWSATLVYLGFMAHIPDSHVWRKFGAVEAERLQNRARSHFIALYNSDNPKTYLRELLKFDQALKLQGINPGTSADLTVATLLMERLNLK